MMFKFHACIILVIFGMLYLQLCSSTVPPEGKNTPTRPPNVVSMKLHSIFTKDPRKLMKVAKELFILGDNNGAEEFSTKAIKHDSSDAQASYYVFRGKCRFGSRNPLGAYGDFKEALSLASKSGVEIDLNAQNFVELAEQLQPLKNYEEAIWCYDEAIKKQPKNAKYYEKRGLCYFQMKNWDMAASDFREEFKIDSDNIGAFYYFVRTLFTAGKVDEAVKATQTWDWDRLMQVGKKFTIAKEYQEALKIFTEAVERFQSLEAYKLRGECYLNLNEPDRAIADFRKRLEIVPENVNSQRDLTNLLYKLGRHSELVGKLSTFDVDELLHLGTKFVNGNDFHTGLKFYTEAVDRFQAPEAYKLRGELYLKIDETDRAISDFKKGLDIDPENFDIRLDLSDLYYELGKYKEAIDEATHLDDNCLESLGNKFFRENKFQEALRCYDKAVVYPRYKRNRSDFNTALLYAERGRCYGALGKYGDAISDFKKSLFVCSDRDTTLLSLVGLFEVQMKSGKVTEADQNRRKSITISTTSPALITYFSNIG